jgi:hypothetical protein
MAAHSGPCSFSFLDLARLGAEVFLLAPADEPRLGFFPSMVFVKVVLMAVLLIEERYFEMS